MEISEDYNRFISPLPSLSSSPSNAELKTNLMVSVDIQDIIRVSEVEGEFEIKTHIWIEWFDPRLAFKDLKRNTLRNTLSADETENIWKPVMVIDNIKEIDSVRYYKEDKIRVNSAPYSYTNAGYADLKNSRVFQGSVNSLVLDKYLRLEIEQLCEITKKIHIFSVLI